MRRAGAESTIAARASRRVRGCAGFVWTSSPCSALAHQDQKAYQCVLAPADVADVCRKQPIFQNAKSRPGQKRSTRERRWYKDVGLGFKTPRTAIDGTYIGARRPRRRGAESRADKKCPFTGEVAIRGRILTGRVVSTKMTRTIVIRREYLHFVRARGPRTSADASHIPKYQRCTSQESSRSTWLNAAQTRSATRRCRRTARLRASLRLDHVFLTVSGSVWRSETTSLSASADRCRRVRRLTLPPL